MTAVPRCTCTVVGDEMGNGIFDPDPTCPVHGDFETDAEAVRR